MEKKELHPSIEKFKLFVKSNPKIIQGVRSDKFTWQELYEDWYLLGEEDPRWDEFRNEVKKSPSPPEPKTDWIGQIMGAVKKIDSNQLEGHIHNLSQTLSAIQGVIAQFQVGTQSKPIQKSEHLPHPFMFRKD